MHYCPHVVARAAVVAVEHSLLAVAYLVSLGSCVGPCHSRLVVVVVADAFASSLDDHPYLELEKAVMAMEVCHFVAVAFHMDPFEALGESYGDHMVVVAVVAVVALVACLHAEDLRIHPCAVVVVAVALVALPYENLVAVEVLMSHHLVECPYLAASELRDVVGASGLDAAGPCVVVVVVAVVAVIVVERLVVDVVMVALPLDPVVAGVVVAQAKQHVEEGSLGLVVSLNLVVLVVVAG